MDLLPASGRSAETLTTQPQARWQSGFSRACPELPAVHVATAGDHAILYTPGVVCVLANRDLPAALRCIERLAKEPPAGEESQAVLQSEERRAAAHIVRAAREAVLQVARASDQAFAPECLTVYVNNRCNMSCRYCYSKPDASGDSVSAEGVRAASRLVAGACAERNVPFSVAFHGGGEPALDPQYVDLLLDIAREEARRFGLCPRTYISTNGAVSDDAAAWLATRFDLVGVSCDGPPEVQDRYRPGRDGRPRSALVEGTLSTLSRLGRPFHIRATISRETVERQSEIVSYMADCCAPAEIRLEPVYSNQSGEPPLAVADAAAFVSGFVAARKASAERGIPVTTSITRPDAVYGPYCNVLRRVLNLIPGDVATACFLKSRPSEVARRGLQTGSLDSTGTHFRMDEEVTRSLIARCSARPAACGDCLCSIQCTLGCPDRCVLEACDMPPLYGGERESLRCLVNRMLMESSIREAADRAWAAAREGHCQETQDAGSALSVTVLRR